MIEKAEPPQITVLLQRAAGGDRAALDAVYVSLYPELKQSFLIS